jgi:uncharacterized repeat protein (TIGR03803 family)
MQISLCPRRAVAAFSFMMACLFAQSPAFAERTQQANFIRVNTEAAADRPFGVRGNLLLATDGNIYFATTIGGNGRGSIGKLAPDGTISTLYAFPAESDHPVRPQGNLIQANDGHLYGTSFIGGADGRGTIFRVTLTGEFTLLRSMGATPTDASLPYTGLVQASDNKLYGTTLSGGNNDKGTIFRIALDGSNFEIIHHFSGANGENPEGQLLVGSDGELYGTTLQGGQSNRGAIYKISTSGVFTLLYSVPSLSAFGDLGTAINATGANPRAGLMLAADGNYYGTAYQGGPGGNGTVFRMTPAGVVSVFHAFAGATQDGGFPLSSVTQDAQGNFYGTTQHGGYQDAGSAYRLSSTGEFTLLHGFIDTFDGANPHASLLLANGTIYGASCDCEAQSDTRLGTLFKLDLGSNGALPVDVSVSSAKATCVSHIAGECGVTATVTWSSPTAASAKCNASGSWTNAERDATGTETVALSNPAIYIYVLSCTDGAGVVRSAYATITVESPDRRPVDGGGGTGALSMTLLLLLAMLLFGRRLRENFTACR